MPRKTKKTPMSPEEIKKARDKLTEAEKDATFSLHRIGENILASVESEGQLYDPSQSQPSIEAGSDADADAKTQPLEDTTPLDETAPTPKIPDLPEVSQTDVIKFFQFPKKRSASEANLPEEQPNKRFKS